MLEIYQNEIPKIEMLREVLRSVLDDPRYDLADIRDIIFEHINNNIVVNDFKIYSDTINDIHGTAYDAVESLIASLEVCALNYWRLKKHYKTCDSYYSMISLIKKYKKYMDNKEISELTSRIRQTFPEMLEDEGSGREF